MSGGQRDVHTHPSTFPFTVTVNDLKMYVNSK